MKYAKIRYSYYYLSRIANLSNSRKETMGFIYLLGFTLLLQQVHGNWFESHLEDMASSLLKPINKLNDHIKAGIGELESKQVELKNQKLYLSAKLKSVPEECLTENLLSHAKLHSQWDLESCLDLTGDWKDGVLFSMKFTIHSINVTTEIWNTINNGMNCSEVSVWKMPTCYYKTFSSLKDQISYLKGQMEPFMTEGKQILLNMKKDLKYCLGIPQSLQYRIERYISNCVKNDPQRLLEGDPQRLSSVDELF